MASQYTYGTLNEADAGSLGLAMVEQLRDDMVAHAAWELVEEFTPAGGVARWYVLKCLATESGLPIDFYVVFGRRLSDGYLIAFLCEDYDSGTHTASHYGAYITWQSVAYDSLGRQPHTFVLGTALPSSGTSHPNLVSWNPSGTATKWWLIVNDDQITVAFNGVANGCWDLGAYEPICATPIPVPLMLTGTGLPSGVSSITRNPAVASITFSQFAVGWGGMAIGFTGRMDVNDKLNGNKRPVSEYGMYLVENNNGVDRATQGWAFGKRKRLRFGTNPPAGVAFQDAYVLENKLWVPYHPTDTAMWDTGVAAS